MTSQTRIAKIADILGWLIVAGWIGYASIGFNVFGRATWPDATVDYRLIYDYSRSVVQEKTYPANAYPYPPSGVLLHYATAQFPYRVSAGLYLAGSSLAAIGCWWILRRMVQSDRLPGSAVLMLPAMAVTSSSLMWDLKSQNCNVFFLLFLLLGARALTRDRLAAAGFWLASSIALKLFSVVVLPYLFWCGRRRAFAWTLLASVGYWVVLPACVFGIEGSIQVYGAWFEQVSAVTQSRPDVQHPILISLHNAAVFLFASDADRGRLFVHVFQALWLGVLVGGWLLARRRRDAPGDSIGLLADLSLLVLAPVAVSPYLESFHVIPIAMPAWLLVWTAGDARQSTRIRGLAASLVVLLIAISRLPWPWQMDGLLVNLEMLVACSGAAVVARFRQPTPAIAEHDASDADDARAGSSPSPSRRAA